MKEKETRGTVDKLGNRYGRVLGQKESHRHLMSPVAPALVV